MGTKVLQNKLGRESKNILTRQHIQRTVANTTKMSHGKAVKNHELTIQGI